MWTYTYSRASRFERPKSTPVEHPVWVCSPHQLSTYGDAHLLGIWANEPKIEGNVPSHENVIEVVHKMGNTY